ncbi:MAG: AAA family ATPase [Candidatus Electrothrix gigas]
MSIYQEILDWSQNRPEFIKDALRRIILNSNINQNDIDELVQLLKKENGDTSISINAVPFNNSHIPSSAGSLTHYPRLLCLEQPINICALHNQGKLQFASSGLTVIYGNNGSGKSSYSRILKKLCWSRNSNIELKKNVFTPTSTQQQVDFEIDINGTNTSFQWTENNPSHPALNSINVFDTNCVDIYINSENPTEYKPVGIDVLERLIPILNEMSQSLNNEVALYTTTKPPIDQQLNSTPTGQWYYNFENLTRPVIDGYIQFSAENAARKQELHKLINTQNPQENIKNLTGLKARLDNYSKQFEKVEALFNEVNITEIKRLRTNFENTNKAYDILTNELKEINTIEGFGSNPWRVLWEAAQKFAQSSGMTEGDIFPSSSSLEKCVLCQQDLDEAAQKRLIGFNQFISNDISTKLSAAQNGINNKIQSFESLVALSIDNFKELTQYIPDFENIFNSFSSSVESFKSKIIDFLSKGEELNIGIAPISVSIRNLISDIDRQLAQNNQLLKDRNTLIEEYNELFAKEYLFNNKNQILKYYDELKYKSWISRCQSNLNTTSVSRKIGTLMKNQAISLQHQEFINHLNYFNSEIATKVLLSKSRTSQGSTFQKCNLNGINHSIESILSEGEQKIIALSNFLAECTIDSRKNTIVFDDPVNSLDMDYRDLIANKIVTLSQDRQIIVLTHDLSFLRLLIDTHKTINSSDCGIIGIDKYNGISGIITDEIPYLAKNVQERINSIRQILVEHDALQITDAHGRETKLDSARKRFRMLLERSVEEILSNKTYERFSKNIHLKKRNLSSYIVTEQSDIDFLLNLFGKYSVTEHDGGTTTIPILPNKTVIEQDIRDYSIWKDGFKAKLKTFVDSYN